MFGASWTGTGSSGVLRLDRSRTAGPLLEWKVAIFLVAAGLGLGGIFLEEGWLTGAAILVLLGGVLLRASTRPSPEGEGRDEGDEDDPDPREASAP